MTAAQSPTPLTETQPDPISVRTASLLLAATAAFFLILAVGFNGVLIRLVFGLESTPPGRLEEIRFSQLWFLILSILFLTARLALRRNEAWRTFFAKPGRTEALLVLLIFVCPIAALEIAGRPLLGASSKTWIFMKDDELGWRLRPKSSDQWGGVPVRINAKGLRGPEVPYERSGQTYRILYLGDSITFGFGIEKDEETYPYRVEAHLESDGGIEVETINAGVGGYSPWQELIYLKREGVRYSPDLVVLGFYLNDVTEKFSLPQFGGKGGSYQLNHAYSSAADRWLAWSGGWAALKRVSAHFTLGPNLQRGARELQALHVERLLTEPDEPFIRRAWEITLGNMEKIVSVCREKDLDLLLIVFPDTIQVEAPDLGEEPQEILAKFAEVHSLPCLDLLPALRREVNNGTSLDELYRDSNHPTAAGADWVAREAAPFILREFLGNEENKTEEMGQ